MDEETYEINDHSGGQDFIKIFDHKILKIYGIRNEDFKFYSNGTHEQRDQASSHDWNNNLFYEIINFNNFGDLFCKE